MSVSDISANSTDSLLVLTPRSSEIITRPDLPLFERQNNFKTDIKQSFSDLTVNLNRDVGNKFSSTSVDTVVEKKNSDSQLAELEQEYLLERKDSSSRLNFGLIDITVKASLSRIMPHILKYIPVNCEKPNLIPPCLHNEVNQSEWWELQASLTGQTFGTTAHATSSETGVQDRKKYSKKNNKRKLKRLFMCTAAQDSPMKLHRTKELPLKTEENCCERVETADSLEQTESELPSLSSSRFNQTNNENYIKVSCNEKASFTATLYTPLPEDPNFDLCHYQTVMAVTAMLAFFHPWSEIHCVWVPSLRSKIADLLHEGLALRPKFARSVRMCEFKAVLVVSEDAGGLFRHRDMNFLHSLAAALGIEAKHLLVLVREGTTCLDTTVKV